MAQKLNFYELTYIIDGVLSEDTVKEMVGKVEEFIKDQEGNVVHSEAWGNRKLAYPVKKKRTGYYMNLYFNAPGDMLVRFERMLEITDEVLRYMTLRYDAKMIRHFEKQKGVDMAFLPSDQKPKEEEGQEEGAEVVTKES